MSDFKRGLYFHCDLFLNSIIYWKIMIELIMIKRMMVMVIMTRVMIVIVMLMSLYGDSYWFT